MADSKQLSNFINGEFVAPTGGGYSDVINPSTGEAYLAAPLVAPVTKATLSDNTPVMPGMK